MMNNRRHVAIWFMAAFAFDAMLLADKSGSRPWASYSPDENAAYMLGLLGPAFLVATIATIISRRRRP